MGLLELFSEGKKYLKDAMPGGLLNQEWTPENVRTAAEVTSMIPNPVGDVASGLLAADDLRKGNYGDAALNGLGLLPFVPSVAGMFAGKGAKTADLAKQGLAEKLLKDGVDPAEVWKKTGWGKGPDGKWRFEISDKQASLTGNKFPANSQTTVENTLSHDDLYAAYPELRNVTITWNDKASPLENAVFNPRTNNIAVNPFWHRRGDSEVEMAYGNLMPSHSKTSLLHEMQHAVQDGERFASGGNARVLSRSEYERLLGEAESRMTEFRAGLSPLQRSRRYPYDPDYFKKATGVNLEDVIIKY